jgi:hypothetical protein
MGEEKQKDELELSRKDGLLLGGILLGSIASAGVGLSVTFDTVSKSSDPLVGGLIGACAGVATSAGILAVSSLSSSVLLKIKPLDILKMVPTIMRSSDTKITLAIPILFGTFLGASACWDDQKNLSLEKIDGNTQIVETITTTVRDRACGNKTSGVALYTDKNGNGFQVACAPQ